MTAGRDKGGPLSSRDLSGQLPPFREADEELFPVLSADEDEDEESDLGDADLDADGDEDEDE